MENSHKLLHFLPKWCIISQKREEPAMQIHYDVDRIKHILQSLTRLTGISLSFMNTEQEYLCYC